MRSIAVSHIPNYSICFKVCESSWFMQLLRRTSSRRLLCVIGAEMSYGDVNCMQCVGWSIGWGSGSHHIMPAGLVDDPTFVGRQEGRLVVNIDSRVASVGTELLFLGTATWLVAK